MRTFEPLNVVALFYGGVPMVERPLYSTIERIRLYAGSAIGSAVVSYPANHPDNPVASMGWRVRIRMGTNVWLFSGVAGSTPVAVGESGDALQLVLFDDKFLLQADCIGEIGIGPDAVNGFPDVGFDVVFNRNGKPNKDPALLTFNTGSTAVFWTLRDIQNFLFAWYVDGAVATLAAAQIAHDAWSAVPSQVNLVGQTALQAIDAVAELAGETWTLLPGAGASAYRSIRKGFGTVRTASVYRPGAGAGVESATENYPSDIEVGASIQNCKDIYQVVSAPIVKECVHTNKGSNPLLTRVSGSKDKGYANGTRFQVDVTKYAAWSLGVALSAGSPPKPWLSNLVTRLNAGVTDYVTKAEMDAAPGLAMNKRVEIPVWVSVSGDVGDLKLLTGGYRIDTEKASIDFMTTLDIAPATPGDNPEKIEVTDWSTARVALTVATVLELPENYTTTTGSATYLTSPMTQMIPKPDLVPERRQNSWLPNLGSSDPHAYTALLTGGSEDRYVTVTTRLLSAAQAALARSPEIETPIDIVLELFPIWNVGDRLSLAGRNLGQTGDEVITEIEYGVHHQYETRVKATNLMIGVDPEKFARRRT